MTASLPPRAQSTSWTSRASLFSTVILYFRSCSALLIILIFRCYGHREQLAINKALVVVAEELDVLHEVTTYTRNIIEAADFADVQRAIAVEIGDGPVPPPNPPAFPYPAGIHQRQLFDGLHAVSPHPPPGLDFVQLAEFRVADLARTARALREYWLGTVKLIKWNDTRWNGKRNAIVRSARKRYATQRLLLKRGQNDLLNRYTSSMSTLSSFIRVNEVLYLFPLLFHL